MFRGINDGGIAMDEEIELDLHSSYISMLKLSGEEVSFGMIDNYIIIFDGISREIDYMRIYKEEFTILFYKDTKSKYIDKIVDQLKENGLRVVLAYGADFTFCGDLKSMLNGLVYLEKEIKEGGRKWI